MFRTKAVLRIENKVDRGIERRMYTDKIVIINIRFEYNQREKLQNIRVKRLS